MAYALERKRGQCGDAFCVIHMQSNAADRLLDFVLSQSAGQPLALRIQIYRDAAQVIASERVAKKLRALAEECESIERRHHQLRLDLGDGGTN